MAVFSIEASASSLGRPSIEALEQRLRARGQDDEVIIARRMRGAKEELAHQDEYNHIIVNDDFDTALAELGELLN